MQAKKIESQIRFVRSFRTVDLGQQYDAVPRFGGIFSLNLYHVVKVLLFFVMLFLI